MTLVVKNICPDVQTKLDQGLRDMGADQETRTKVEALKKAKKYAVDGETYLIGSELAPGTYQTIATKVTDCYWEARNSNGEFVDNNFANGAPQFEVDVTASGGAFNSAGCGDFIWIG